LRPLFHLQLLSVAQRELHPKPGAHISLFAVRDGNGIGISVRNAQAVIEALLGKKSEFTRTPKFNIEGSGARSRKMYRNKAGWMPYAEVLLGLYFSLTIVYAVGNETMPPSVPSALCWATCNRCMSLAKLTCASPLRRQRPEMRPATSGAPGF